MTTIPETRPDLRRERGDRTRRAILESAARLSSVEGLEGLSIGRLAEHLGISKSGLYAHFRSKEELQLATVRTAEAMYEEALVQPALQETPGVGRVLRFADLYLDYLRDGPFPGGCFFIAASIDPARNRGPVKEALAASQAQLLEFFADEIATAQSQGQVPEGTGPRELAFVVDGILAGADLNFLLFDDPNYLELAKDAVRRALAQPARPPSR
jgi:AcrR family transcriptional regulator